MRWNARCLTPAQELQADLAVLSEAIEALCASAVHPLPVFMHSDSSSDLMA